MFYRKINLSKIIFFFLCGLVLKSSYAQQFGGLPIKPQEGVVDVLENGKKVVLYSAKPNLLEDLKRGFRFFGFPLFINLFLQLPDLVSKHPHLKLSDFKWLALWPTLIGAYATYRQVNSGVPFITLTQDSFTDHSSGETVSWDKIGAIDAYDFYNTADGYGWPGKWVGKTISLMEKKGSTHSISAKEYDSWLENGDPQLAINGGVFLDLIYYFFYSQYNMFERGSYKYKDYIVRTCDLQNYRKGSTTRIIELENSKNQRIYFRCKGEKGYYFAFYVRDNKLIDTITNSVWEINNNRIEPVDGELIDLSLEEYKPEGFI